VKLTLVCPAAAIGSCAGTDVLTTARKVRAAKGKKARVLVLGKGKFSIAPGATGTVTIKLSKAALKLLAGKRTLKARQTTAASDSRNVPVTTTGPLKLGRGAKRGRR
jgi:hypothetical protein